MPKEYHEPPAPLKNSEQITELMVWRYLNTPGTHMPFHDQESHALLIETNKDNPEEMMAAREERIQLVEEIDRLLDEEIYANVVSRVTEMQRGEIIEMTIKKLVQRKKDLERKK